jgi:hypothetical protein
LGYDVEFVLAPSTQGLKFPMEPAQAAKLLKKPAGIGEPAQVRDLLLALSGAKPGPGESIDYIGQGLNYARLTVKPDRIHVENNCGPRELLKIHEHLAGKFPSILIHDLQSGHLHTAKSLQEWWAKPL